MDVRGILFLCVMVFLAGCATVPRAVPPSTSQETLQALCARYNMECRWDGISQTVDMTYARRKIRALVGSNIVLVDNNRLALSDGLRRKKGAIMVPADFEQVVIGTSGKPQDAYQKVARAGRIKKVMIDAGHGGKDPGAVGYRGVREKDINLDIALRAAEAFQAAGIKAVLTRDSDDFITLQERTERASQSGVDLFVSIHANANKSRGASGVEVYYADPLGIEDKFSDQRRINEKKFVAPLNMNKENVDVRKIIADMLYSYKLSLSPGLAESVARGLSFEISGKARGSKPQRYYVLRNTLIPAVLIEVGFITNPEEAKLLQDKSYRQRIADAITKNVLRYGNASGM
ncbi:MAG: N-acetylmuramoyl-L-alanine amidase [Candidatus Omnitrophica bacterium]|nr:N-acetylmuramoyl-L-alanine amidase [Candidatus Omnitrophota bacterium]